MTRFLRSSSSSSSSVRFVDLALSTTGPRSLSYVHQNLKWIIREHVLSLIKEFPTLSPSPTTSPTRTASPSTSSASTAASPWPAPAALDIAIWLHQSYPFVPPIVYLSSASAAEIDRSNPLVDASTGAASTPYLKTWQYPNSNLRDLVRNLVNVFTQWPPFVRGPPTEASRGSSGEGEAQRDGGEDGGEGRRGAKLAVGEQLGAPAVAEAAPEEVFEVMDDKSKFVLKNEAESLAIDDVVWVLDEALMKRTVEFHDYIKQVRVLYREQFFHAPC
ncbi:unnamed protein product [Spirodela intermedia]|uniref:Uncharacterized protein n=1 Tax=Spirodela intermedia TaxID=51605 RepID=A0A7I8IY33_SPIIN|nr:unnamed protein product [Spirodela intermedia]CAA6662768.1 unnamed protein product [Spirodela intermedia]